MKRFFQILLIVVFFLPTNAWSLDVVPGLKGFGTHTRAAYGAVNDPVICIVTDLTNDNGTLGDSSRNGTAVKTGSFLECVNYSPPANTGKIILFEVSGTINDTTSTQPYKVDVPYTTIAGQSAPSPGISLRNIVLQVRTHDVLVQHLRSRVGDAATGVDPDNRRAIEVNSKSSWGTTTYNVVLDHLSASWGIDTCMTIYSQYSTHDVTVANCIIAEGLYDSLHSEGTHSKGLALQIGTDNISAINNLIINNVDRNPYVRYGDKVMVNNYTYNYRDTCLSLQANSGVLNTASVGNVCDRGPNTAGGGTAVYHAILWNDPSYSSNWDNSNIYFLDNVYDTVTQSNSSDWSKVQNKYSDEVSPYKVTGETPSEDAPLWPTGLSPMASGSVKAYVSANAGARPADRDSVDTRLVAEVAASGGGIIDSPSDVGGWPNLAVNHRTLNLPANPHADDDNDGYTNLEEWLHGFSAQVEGKSEGTLLSPPSGLKILTK